MSFSAGGNFQSLKYDPVTYATDIKQSTQPLKYRMDPLYANTCGDTCRPSDVGYISRVGVSIDRQHSLSDTESDLRLLNYRASQAPQDKYLPEQAPGYFTGYPNGGGIQHRVMEQDANVNPSDKFHFPECKKLRTEYTRITYPTCDLKGTGVNRFQPICLDPQHPSRWIQPSEIGINYRMVAKDNHRPCIPKPLDQTLAHPKPNNGGSLPVEQVTLSYLTTPYMDYGHPHFCNKDY